MKIPSLITAGDSVTWTDYAFPDPQGANVGSLDYTLTYSFRGPGVPLDLVGTPQGTGWLLSMTAAQSALFNAGNSNLTWFWQAYAVKALVRVTAGDGTLVVKPNFSAITSTTFDASSPNEKMLKSIQAELQLRIEGGAVVEYNIGTRSLKKETTEQLTKLLVIYQNKVSRERRAQMIKNGLGNPSRVGVRFK